MHCDWHVLSNVWLVCSMSLFIHSQLSFCRGQQQNTEGDVVCKPSQRLDFELEMVSSLRHGGSHMLICTCTSVTQHDMPEIQRRV